MIEMGIAVVIAALVMLVIHQLCSHYVSASLKGQDALTSVREALQVLEHIRREAMMSTNVASPPARIGDAGTAPSLDDPDHELTILGPEGTIVYELVTDPQGNRSLRRTVTLGSAVEQRTLSVGRVRDFLVYWLVRKHRCGAQVFVTRSLSVQLVLQGTDLRGTPATEVKVGTLISPPFSAYANSTWPH